MPPNPPTAAHGGGTAGAGAGTGTGHPPISAQQSTSQSHFFNPHSQSGRQQSNGRLPRLPSLLPPATFTSSHLDLSASKPLPSPHGPTSNPISHPLDSGRLETTSRNERQPHPHHHHNRHLDEARPSQPDRLHPFNHLSDAQRSSGYYVNRWSASTNSSHGHSASLSRSPPPPRSPTTPTRRSSSVDITFFLAGSPPSANVASWNHRMNRIPTESHHHLASQGASDSSPDNSHNYRGNQRLAAPDSSRPRTTNQQRYLSRDNSFPAEEHNEYYEPQSGQAGDSRSSPSRPKARVATTESVAMQYESGGQEHYYAKHGHTRSRSGKSSSDSTKHRSGKPPSQKAMLSNALQRANAAVQLDNAQDFSSARSAYMEACTLLEQVLQRTTAQEDQRKLEAIVSLNYPPFPVADWAARLLLTNLYYLARDLFESN